MSAASVRSKSSVPHINHHHPTQVVQAADSVTVEIAENNINNGKNNSEGKNI